MTNVMSDGCDDIISVIFNSIYEINTLINLVYTCKKTRQNAIDTVIYKEEKLKKENIALCNKMEDIIIKNCLKI